MSNLPHTTSPEKEAASSSGEGPALKETGEAALPSEVAGAGVKVQATTVTIPPTVAQMGVQPVGQAQSPVTTTALPLTDDQIVKGLHEGVTSSWRWLALWCIRRLKQVHLFLKSIHGKIVRVQT